MSPPACLRGIEGKQEGRILAQIYNRTEDNTIHIRIPGEPKRNVISGFSGNRQ